MERHTRQRDAITQALKDADRPLSPLEIQQLAARHKPGIGVATIYRNINALKEEGHLLLVDVPGQPPRYELAGKDHHHHFHCRKCDRVYEMHGCPGPLEKLAPRGFKVEGHELMLYGLCKACSKPGR